MEEYEFINSPIANEFHELVIYFGLNPFATNDRKVAIGLPVEDGKTIKLAKTIKICVVFFVIIEGITYIRGRISYEIPGVFSDEFEVLRE